MSNLFPQGVALGEGFYNREHERHSLKLAIEHARHTVLIAPRRYGKTSLMRRVLSENNYPFIWIDFLTFTSSAEAKAQILKQVGQLVIRVGGTEQKIKSLAKKFLSFLRPEIHIDIHSLVKIHFHPEPSLSNQSDSFIQALIAVDKITQHTKQSAVIVFDEFQEIIDIDERNAFQASIRHAAELSKSITYLFSGSRHTALRKIFTGKKQPLYELCDLMPLHKVSEEYYLNYITNQSIERWGKSIDQKDIKIILEHTECYPQYVNTLCAKLWMNGSLPNTETIQKTWQEVVFSRKDPIHLELERLKINERRLLYLLCEHPTHQPYSIDYVKRTNLSPTSLRRALEDGLLQKEIVMQDSQTKNYSVVDPILKAYIKMVGLG